MALGDVIGGSCMLRVNSQQFRIYLPVVGVGPPSGSPRKQGEGSKKQVNEVFLLLFVHKKKSLAFCFCGGFGVAGGAGGCLWSGGRPMRGVSGG